MRLSKLIFLLLLVPVLVFARGDYYKGSYTETVVTCDDCSGALKFAWHMEDDDATPDVTIGNPCGCSDNDSIGAIIGSPVFSTVQKSDGTYSLHIDAKDEYVEFSVTTDDIIEADNVKITFDIYIVSYPATAGYIDFFYAVDDASNNLSLRVRSTGVVEARYYGQATEDIISVAVATGGWVSCEYQAKTGVAGNDHYLICGETSAEEDDDLVAFAATADSIQIGDRFGSVAGEYYLDNLKIYPCDRY